MYIVASLTAESERRDFTWLTVSISLSTIPFSSLALVSSLLVGYASLLSRTAHPISLVIGTRSTLRIAYKRNANDRRWKNERSTTSRSWNYPLICAYELRGALFGFGKIVNGDAQGEILERRPASRHRRCAHRRSRVREKKAKEREMTRNAERIGVFHARGFVANQLISPQFALISIWHVCSQVTRSKTFRSSSQ